METKLTEQKRREMYIANHNCCLLAESMKICEVCLFRIGINNTEEVWKEIMDEVKKSEEKERAVK